jgi:hypothetical protein
MKKLAAPICRATLLAVCSFALSSCLISHINVSKGVFEASKPPSVYGNERRLEHGISPQVSLQGSVGKNKTVALEGLMNQSTGYGLPQEPANISYRFDGINLGGQFTYTYKSRSDWFFGFSGGYQDMPYVTGLLGVNKDFWEIGFSHLIGIASNEATYSGTIEQEPFCFIEDPCTDDWDLGPFSVENESNLNLYMAANLHASVFLSYVSLGWTGGVAVPWSQSELYSESTYTFEFPLLFSNDIGMAWNYHHFKFRLGANWISGPALAESVLSITSQAAWIF